MEKERLFLRPEQFYTDQNITLRLGNPVTAIDPKAQTITVAGEVLAYDQLALTTGSNPRHLPANIGGALDGVHVVRSLDDVDAMGAEMSAGKRALIIGGGYIGLEAAAVASKMGLEVTVVEMADPRWNVDVVIVGVGITPGDALASEAGLTINNGIETDAHGRTSDPNIWAAGDCASFPWQEGRIRLESVQNAIDQAELVAENIMGAGKDYVPAPWFWSDQYDVKLQIAGLNTGYDTIAVRQTGGYVLLVLQGRQTAGRRRNERPAELHDRQALDRGGQKPCRRPRNQS
ncbi:Rhodocoxin reductase [Nymphon striatum]|nr:Rhodocoxin reductase [Nymphon striatum]